MKKVPRRYPCCPRQSDTYSQVAFSAPPNDVVTQYRLMKAKSEIASAQNSAKANIDFITQQLQIASIEAENLRKSITDLEFLISSSKCKTIHPKKLSNLCKVTSSFRIDLKNVLQHEKQLKRQLQDARITFRNAKLDDHIINEDIKKFKNKSWDYHTIEKEVTEQRRLEREIQSKKNAISTREETITSVANSITVHVLRKLPGENNDLQKRLNEAKSAREGVSKYVEKSLRDFRETKAIIQTEMQIRQRRQAENLAKLKQELKEIKQTLAVKSHLRHIHEEEIAAEKEEVKGLLKAQGVNPYLAEYLLAIEEKQREQQRKMLVEEQQRLLDIQNEYSIIEASKAKEEADRKKWNQYWSQKAADKAMMEKQNQLEMYFDLSVDEEEHKDPMKTQIQDKVVEQHQRFSQYQAPVMIELPHDGVEDQNEEEEETLKLRDSQQKELDVPPPLLSTPKPFQTKASIQFKPQGQPAEYSASNSKRDKKTSQAESIRSSKSKSKDFRRSKAVSNAGLALVVPLRKAVHLKESQKELLLRMAGTGENAKAMLMNDRNVFDFGNVPVGKRKYIMVNVANVGIEPVQLKMSVLNPYGPFVFCNSLKAIPQDSYFSLKFKYQPTVANEKSQETVKIEEVGKPENFFIIKLKGNAMEGGGDDE